MVNNSLLADAIEDAKNVRMISYANAKKALEDAFSREFDAMYIEKNEQKPARSRNMSIHTLKN